MRLTVTILYLLLTILSISQELEKEVNLFLNNKRNQRFIQDHGYYFINIPEEKNYHNRLSGTINNIDTSKIDFNNINIKFSMDDYKYYLINDLNIILVLKSINHIKEQLNK